MIESPYFTSEEAATYLRFPTVRAFYEFLRRTPDFPKLRRGGALLFERRLCDAYVRGELRHGRSLSLAKGQR